MRQRLILLAIVAGIPIFAAAAASGLLWKHERDWQAAIAAQAPEVSAERRAAFTIERACRDPEFRKDMGEACQMIDNRYILRGGAAVTGAAGLAWLGLIWLAGRVARVNRTLLLHVFKPGLYLTNLFVVGLIGAHAVLAIVSLYLLEAEFIGRVHVGIMAGIGLGAVAGVFAVAKASFSAVRTATASVVGRSVPRNESPELWQFVADAARDAGVAPPRQIVAGLDPNFFVTEAPVRSLSAEHTGRTLYVSLPLARILSRDEMRAVIGHELGHFKGRDTAFSQKFYPIYRGTHESLAALAATAGEGASQLALLPAISTLSFFLDAFEVAESTIGRERELAADRVGAEIASPAAQASALVKIHAFADLWDPVMRETAMALKEGKAAGNMSEAFRRLVAEHATPERLAGVADRHTPHPTDSHPTLGIRLASLGVTLDAAREPALRVAPDQAAIALVAEAEALEDEISKAEQALLAEMLGVDLPSAPAAPEASVAGR